MKGYALATFNTDPPSEKDNPSHQLGHAKKQWERRRDGEEF
jgi:hypothetical protein